MARRVTALSSLKENNNCYTFVYNNSFFFFFIPYCFFFFETFYESIDSFRANEIKTTVFLLLFSIRFCSIRSPDPSPPRSPGFLPSLCNAKSHVVQKCKTLFVLFIKTILVQSSFRLERFNQNVFFKNRRKRYSTKQNSLKQSIDYFRCVANTFCVHSILKCKILIGNSRSKQNIMNRVYRCTVRYCIFFFSSFK